MWSYVAFCLLAVVQYVYLVFCAIKVTKLQEYCLEIDGDVMAFAEFLIDDAFNQLMTWKTPLYRLLDVMYNKLQKWFLLLMRVSIPIPQTCCTAISLESMPFHWPYSGHVQSLVLDWISTSQYWLQCAAREHKIYTYTLASCVSCAHRECCQRVQICFMCEWAEPFS